MAQLTSTIPAIAAPEEVTDAAETVEEVQHYLGHGPLREGFRMA